MKGHPGGEEHTRHMLALSGLEPPARILDMGAGAGESVELLKRLGYQTQGIDFMPEGENVSQGDFLRTSYPHESFDGVLSQCAFYVSGDTAAAFAESFRLLKKGGVLMLSDVCFSPLDITARKAGFTVERLEDMTPIWRVYYLEALWRDTADCMPIKEKGKCSYLMLICRKD